MKNFSVEYLLSNREVLSSDDEISHRRLNISYKNKQTQNPLVERKRRVLFTKQQTFELKQRFRQQQYLSG